MRVAIVFYSFSGNTKKVALFLKEKLEVKDIKVEVIELKPKKEESSFFKQARDASLKKRPQLLPCEYNLGKYDRVLFGSPVWAFTITPPLRSFLDKVEGLQNKEVCCFLTFGSGVGKGKALKELENILKRKEAKILFFKTLSGSRTEDKDYLERELASFIT
jgi:flavodoxin